MGRKRLQVQVDEELLNDIQRICEEGHMTRSAFVEYTLAMGIRSYKDLMQVAREGVAKSMVGGGE